MPTIDEFIKMFCNDPEYLPNISAMKVFPGSLGNLVTLPEKLSVEISQSLINSGIQQLYGHQAEAFEKVEKGQNIVITTGTASGKTLCYNLPILNSFIQNPSHAALYLFPTKALTYDQFTNLSRLLNSIEKSFVSKLAVYDGDTPAHARHETRKNVRLLMTNPDMLHLAILPHHTQWSDFFHNLRFVVLDEIHYYKGVFGSHVANLIRRMKRIAQFYDSFPQFILTSATIRNAKELSEILIEAPVEVIEHDDSPHGTKTFIMYNPPVVDEMLGIRKSALNEAIQFSQDLLANSVQTITFVKTRRATEMLLKALQERRPENKELVRGYRSGYLAKVRRTIEQGLRMGEIREVISTSALELGIDIGSMDAALIVSFPGSIASLRQQSGRAGRRSADSLTIFIASGNPLDQFLSKHPEYFFGRTPEKVIINPDNLLILLQQLRCAAFELPFTGKITFGKLPESDIKDLLAVLESNGEVFQNNGKYVWTANQYPSAGLSLRSAFGEPFMLILSEHQTEITLGEVDESSAHWMVHPGAIYIQEGRSYLVSDLNFDKHKAFLKPSNVDYYTVPQEQTEVELLECLKHEERTKSDINYGEVLVTSQVVGFKKQLWETNQLISLEVLDMPVENFQTTAYWLSLHESLVDELRESGLWTSDKNDYGSQWSSIRNAVRARDQFTCQVCGRVEVGTAHHVHHKIPFRQFTEPTHANLFSNLITLCSICHQRAEMVLRIKSGLSGLRYVFSQLAPIFVMCDSGDLGSIAEPQSRIGNGTPTIIIYDKVQAGIGLSNSIFQSHLDLIHASQELITHCSCIDGCPSCVGPAGENAEGAKNTTLAILSGIIDK
jgi:DEAD/DEAH box helicase domain-containing protein